MKNAIQWGGINTAAFIVLTLAGYLLGFQGEKLESGQYFQWLGFPIFIAVVVLGMREARDLSGDRGFSYGKGVATAAQIGLFTGIFSSIYTFIHFKFINPEFVDYLMDMIRGKMKDQGVSASDFEKMEGFMRAMYGPAGQAVISFFVGILFSLVIGLIAAAILKRAPSQPAIQA